MKPYKRNPEQPRINGNFTEITSIEVKNKKTNNVLPGNSSIAKKIKNIICFSHLRWDFVFQRPQHLLSRWAREMDVYYVEEPFFGSPVNKLKTHKSKEGVTIVTPHMCEGLSEGEINLFLSNALSQFIKGNNITDYLFWYITPMALPFSKNLEPIMVVYDCMDELSGFKGAHPDTIKNEDALLRLADIVFTGGYHLYEHKKKKHNNIHPFPSSIDQKHFESGIGSPDPNDQAPIPHPRVGFFGVIDERLDIPLLEGLARKMPEVQFIMIGPVVKINPDILPQYSNIHYLGQQSYQDLPKYLANWDVAFLPFAKNDSTRFISPTKTPEYLCAGMPVISTSIRDVVHPYGKDGLVFIADTVSEFSRAIQKAFKQKESSIWRHNVKNMLNKNSWELTWANMKSLILATLENKEPVKELVPLHTTILKVNGQPLSLNRMM